MNVFIPIDHDWSYKFFESNKILIAEIDNFFKFTDDFYASAMLFVTTQINFEYGMTSAKYNEGMTEAMGVCERYPKLATKIADALSKLYANYRIAYDAMQGVVTNVRAIVEPSGVLQGIVFTLDRTLG